MIIVLISGSCTKEDIADKILYQIEDLGFEVKKVEIKEFLDNFEEKFNRLPSESEIKPIVLSYMKIIDHDNEEHLSVRERYKSDEKAILIPKPNGRRLCPICGDDNHYNIHEIIDKAQVFCDYPRIYGKKYYCDQCGVEWKEF